MSARQARESHPVSASQTLAALVRANLRYWPTVAPTVRRELDRWQAPAAAIPDMALRELALSKLREESFNAEVAATLAVLAPAQARTETVRAIVSLELLFDYLDGRTELPATDPIGEGMRLFETFTQALAHAEKPEQRLAQGAARRAPRGPDSADGPYLRALADRVGESFSSLAGAGAVASTAHAGAERCARAQIRLHAATTLGDGQLREWASEQAAESGLEWREHLSGSTSSVLAVHALIAAAADPAVSERDAQRIDAAYLAIGGVVTMLDSLVDRREDMARGEPGLIRLFTSPAELCERLRALTREAVGRAAEAPHSDHHAMTLAGVAAYYTTHPGARDPDAREIVRAVRGELSPTIWPAIAVMSSWRAAKRGRSLLTPKSRPGRARVDTAAGTRLRGRDVQ